MTISPRNRFAAFSFLQNLSRGPLHSLIPLRSCALMGIARDTSVLLFTVSVGGILAALALPTRTLDFTRAT